MTGTRIYAKAVVTGDNGRVLILRRSATHPTKAGKWDLPGGVVNVDEHPAAGTVREVFEETGLRAVMGDVASVEWAYGPPEVPTLWQRVRRTQRRCLGIVYRAAVAEGWNVIQLSHEHDEYAWIEPWQASAYDMPAKYQRVILGLARREIHVPALGQSWAARFHRDHMPWEG